MLNRLFGLYHCVGKKKKNLIKLSESLLKADTKQTLTHRTYRNRNVMSPDFNIKFVIHDFAERERANLLTNKQK